jgi:hypothetical protein
MKKTARFLQLCLLAIVIASFSPVARASDLEKEMKNIGKNTKALKQSVGDPSKKAEALAEIGQMIKSAEKAKTLTPKKAGEIPEAQRPQFIADYQKQIDGLIGQFKKIEADLTADKTADAKSDFEKIGGMKRDGHEKFAAKE